MPGFTAFLLSLKQSKGNFGKEKGVLGKAPEFYKVIIRIIRIWKDREIPAEATFRQCCLRSMGYAHVVLLQILPKTPGDKNTGVGGMFWFVHRGIYLPHGLRDGNDLRAIDHYKVKLLEIMQKVY